MKMKTALLVTSLAFLSWLSLGAWAANPKEKTAFQRLDPHGAPELKLKEVKLAEHSECKVCHFEAGAKIGTKPEPENFCASCHGKLPHSGVLEHMGEEPGGGAGLNCLSCHRPHRAGSEVPPLGKPSFLKRTQGNLPQGLIERSNPGAMFEHPCTECHSF